MFFNYSQNMEKITYFYLLCASLDGASVLSGQVIVLSSFMYLMETPICVPSHAMILGSYLQHGSTSFLKSICMLPMQENIHLTDVLMVIKGSDKMLEVLYFLVISLQKEVNDILELFL